MDSIRLTIGLPVFNGERFLAETVESILAQEYGRFRLLISDNGSTDRTPEIARSFADSDPRVSFQRHDVNRGASWNFNHVVFEAGTEFFKWAAADDVYAPGFTGRCVEALDRDPGVVLAYTQALDVDAGGQAIRAWGSRKVAWHDDPAERYANVVREEGEAFPVFGVMRREILLDTDLHSDYPGCDIVLLAELALRGRFHEVPEALFLHREHPDRSVNAYERERSRSVWFDTSKADIITLPKWRRAFGFLRAARSFPLDRTQRRTAYRAIGHWMARNRRSLTLNLGGAARDHALRLVGRESARSRRSRATVASSR